MINCSESDLICCHICKNVFNDKDIVYCIEKQSFDLYNTLFLTAYYTQDKIRVSKSIRMHDECFLKAAGEDFIFGDTIGKDK